jgi:hypothetical protein
MGINRERHEADLACGHSKKMTADKNLKTLIQINVPSSKENRLCKGRVEDADGMKLGCK